MRGRSSNINRVSSEISNISIEDYGRATVSILGSGTVGHRIGRALSGSHNVIYYDINENVVNGLKIKRFKATGDGRQAILTSNVSFVCVPTPTRDGRMDSRAVEDISEVYGKVLKGAEKYHIFVLTSTVIPGTTENIVIPTLEESSGKHADSDFGVAYMPIFLTEIHGTWSSDKAFKKEAFEDRIVIGESRRSSKAGDFVSEKILGAFKVPKIRTDYKTAEMVKYATNCFLAARISYFNELYFICKELGIDSNIVADAVGLDKRCGKYGTVHGKAFGGKCLPKDLEAFLGFVEENCGYDPKLLRAVAEVNNLIKNTKGVRE